MFPTIEILARDVDAAWSRTGYADTHFHEIAGNFLSRPLDLDFATLARRVCEGAALPEQRRLDQGFGQPAITLYQGEKFSIEALCWHTSTPAIHQHAFSGAFRVVTGSSMHSRYCYTGHDRLGRLSLGELRLERAEFLDTGSTVAIPRGSGLIHANFHLDSPTMTIVLRTHQGVEPELTYLPPGIAYDSSARGASLHKRIQLLDTMHRVGHESYLDCLHAAIGSSDEYEGMTIVMRAGARVEEPVFRELAGRLLEQHGPKADLLICALTEERRRGVIERMRSIVTDPDSRFFLASLLSFSRRQDLLDMMAQRYGDAQGARARVAAGVARLLGGDSDRQLVSAAAAQAMLDGASVESFPRWTERLWERSLADEEAKALTGYYRQILEHPLLTPLHSRDGP